MFGGAGKVRVNKPHDGRATVAVRGRRDGKRKVPPCRNDQRPQERLVDPDLQPLRGYSGFDHKGAKIDDQKTMIIALWTGNPDLADGLKHPALPILRRRPSASEGSRMLVMNIEIKLKFGRLAHATRQYHCLRCTTV